jgi:flavin-dependent dehydrogenase
MFDVTIVGARCAGAPLAMLLARAGHRVQLVDRASFPSDIMSTHYIQPYGIALLEKWGLLDAVAATNCPPITKTTFHFDGLDLSAPPQPGMPTTAYCPRRTVLDKILVDAAVAAGAELQERINVTELLFEGQRVLGIRGRSREGGELESRAKVTVGADGIHSFVARAVGAETYDEHPAYSCGYYTYWSGVEMEGAELYLGQEAGVLAFPTNDGLVCVAVGGPVADFAEYKRDIEGNYLRRLDAVDPDFARRVRAGKREEKWVGTADTENFFRKPYGPGWALVGDAGYHRDPVTGLGIADAFRDAELLAEALDAGLSGKAPMDDALAEYQRKRDEAAKPGYDMTIALASFMIPPEMQAFIDAARSQQAAAQPA